MKSFCLLFTTLMVFATMAFAEKLVIDETFQTGEKLDLKVKIDAGEVDVRKGNSPNECHVVIKYYERRAEADVRYNESKGRMEILVDYNNWKNTKFNDDDDRNNAPYVLIELPYETTLDLDFGFKAGNFDLELGDLAITSFELSNWAGECDLEFDEPNRVEMETLDIDFKVGELDIKKLGNARFSEADINSGIGELDIDFDGDLLERSMARIDLDIGETNISVPNNVGTKLKVSKFLFLSDTSYPYWFEKKGKYHYSENYNNSNKNLYLMISTGIGELSIRVNETN